MAIDLEKRNRVIRKYLPESFSTEDPLDEHKLKDMIGTPIDAMFMEFDQNGQPTNLWSRAKNHAENVPVDSPELTNALIELRKDPNSSATVVFDLEAISRAAGKDMKSIAFLAFQMKFDAFRGMTQDEIADALQRPGALSSSGATELTVSLDEFFDGNDQDDSIAPNLMKRHPGIRTFETTLRSILARPEVLDVRISILEWPLPDDEEDNDMWMAGESAFIWARDIDEFDLEDAVKTLIADGVYDIAKSPQFTVPEGGPPLSEGMRVFQMTWD